MKNEWAAVSANYGMGWVVNLYDLTARVCSLVEAASHTFDIGPHIGGYIYLTEYILK